MMERQQMEAYVDAAAAAIDLRIAAEHRPGVVHYVAIAAAMAELVMTLPLDVDTDPAPVFTPISPGVGAEPDATAPA